MTSTLPKKFEPFAVPGGLKGQLADVSVPDLLQQLRASAATGILTLVAGGARKALYLKDGRVVFASSNLPNDRLGEILLREGKITSGIRRAIKAITKESARARRCRDGALPPRTLGGRAVPVKESVYIIFNWDEGQFH